MVDSTLKCNSSNHVASRSVLLENKALNKTDSDYPGKISGRAQSAMIDRDLRNEVCPTII